MALESLEVRCNPAAIDPGTSIIIEMHPETSGEPVEVSQVAANQGEEAAPLSDVDYTLRVVDTMTGPAASAAGEANINISSFAGQTVRLRIASTNNQGKLIVGIDDVRLLSGNGQDDVIVGGAGRDVLVGGAGADVLDGQGRLLVGTEGGIWHAPSTDEDNNHGTHVAGTIAAVGNNGVSGSESEELVNIDVEGESEGYRRGYVGWVRISPD
jgi:Ca2+-binding RTX toxin-like protein